MLFNVHCRGLPHLSIQARAFLQPVGFQQTLPASLRYSGARLPAADELQNLQRDILSLLGLCSHEGFSSLTIRQPACSAKHPVITVVSIIFLCNCHCLTAVSGARNCSLACAIYTI